MSTVFCVPFWQQQFLYEKQEPGWILGTFKDNTRCSARFGLGANPTNTSFYVQL
jgi:hypothetical protein